MAGTVLETPAPIRDDLCPPSHCGLAMYAGIRQVGIKVVQWWVLCCTLVRWISIVVTFLNVATK